MTPPPPGDRQAEPAHLGRAVRSAMVWNFASMAFGQIAIASVFLLLAARIDPTTFGIFALAAVLTDVFYTLGTSSSVDAIVQHGDYSRRTLSTVTWTTMAICIAATIAFMGCANFYANAIGAPEVAGILEALSLTTLMLPFVIGPTAIMRERMDFKGLAVLGMISALTGSLAALAIAYTPMIEWALVAQRIVTTVTMITLASVRTGLIPSFAFDFSAARTWLSATSRIFAGQGVASATPRAIDLLMGIFFGVAAVGCLRVATKLSELALALFVNPLSQLWVVLLTRARESKESASAIYLQLSTLTSLIALPGFVGLALVSREVVALTLTPDYAPVAGMLAVLGALGVFVPLNNPRNAILTATRRFNSLMKFSVAEFVVTIGGMIAFSYFGYTAMLAGGGVGALVMVILVVPLLLKLTHTHLRDLFNSLLPPYVSVLAMAVGVLALEPLLITHDPLPVLAAKVIIGAVIYIGMLAVFFRQSVFDSFKLVAAR